MENTSLDCLFVFYSTTKVSEQYQNNTLSQIWPLPEWFTRVTSPSVYLVNTTPSSSHSPRRQKEYHVKAIVLRLHYCFTGYYLMF